MPRGDDLDRLVRNVTTAERRVLGAAARAVQTSLRKSVDSGYETRTDVNGRTYIPAKDGHLPQMERSGRLRRSYRYSIKSGAGVYTVIVSENTGYGEYLRDGTAKMQPRRHIPQPGAPMPADWEARARAALAPAVAAAGAQP